MITLDRTRAVHNGKSKRDKNFAVAVYSTHREAEAAVKDLQRSGFDMTHLSIAGRNFHTEEHVVGYYSTGDRMKAWGKLGAFWGGLWGFMFGAFFLIPGLGPVLVAGPLVGWIVGALEGATIAGGLSALGAAMVSVGIPEDSVLKYESEIKAGKYVLLVHGSPNEVSESRALLNDTSHAGLMEFSA